MNYHSRSKNVGATLTLVIEKMKTRFWVDEGRGVIRCRFEAFYKDSENYPYCFMVIVTISWQVLSENLPTTIMTRT